MYVNRKLINSEIKMIFNTIY